MDIPEETVAEIEAKLQALASLDPAELPEPAAELAALLNELLEGESDT
jgi:hypothetical protein